MNVICAPQFALVDFVRDGTITGNNGQGGCEIIQFGRRPIPPRACVVENRTYVRMFLADMLDELGFIAREAGTSDIRTVLPPRPDRARSAWWRP
jgi:hypothetical protein